MKFALVFWLGQHSFGLPLEKVERVLRAVEVTPLPRTPAVVSGVVDLAGEIVPVIDLRRHVGLPPRAMQLEDHLLVVRVAGRLLALWVDRTGEVTTWCSADLLPVATAAADPGLCGIARSADGLILILDLEAFLSPEALDALEALADHA